MGHIYRSRELPHTYSYPKGVKETLTCNNRRAAETWLDEYKVLHDMTLNKQKLELGKSFTKVSYKTFSSFNTILNIDCKLLFV